MCCAQLLCRFGLPNLERAAIVSIWSPEMPFGQLLRGGLLLETRRNIIMVGYPCITVNLMGAVLENGCSKAAQSGLYSMETLDGFEKSI